MSFDAKKQLAIRYLLLSKRDRDVIERSLPTAVTQELASVIEDLESRGIAMKNLYKMDYSLLMRELKAEGVNDTYKNILLMIESKAASLNKNVPQKLVSAINSLLI